MARPLDPNPTLLQQRVLEHIRQTMLERGSPPTEREIADHFRWKSKLAAQRHINALVRKGFLTKTPGAARGLNIPGVAVRRLGLRGVPLVGTAPAGIPIDAVEDVEGTIGIDPAMFPEADVFALRVQGTSMVGAGIRDGDIALVHQTPEAGEGDIVAAVMDGEATLKRFFRRGGRVVLHAENPDFKDLVVQPDVDFTLAGVVVGIVRRTK